MAKSTRVILDAVRQHDEYWDEWLVSDFTEELCRRLESLGLSRTAFAQRIGNTPAYVTKVLRGDENLTAKTMAKLARALGCVVRIHLAPAGRYTVWLDMPDAFPRAVVASNASDDVTFGDPHQAIQLRPAGSAAEVNQVALAN